MKRGVSKVAGAKELTVHAGSFSREGSGRGEAVEVLRVVLFFWLALLAQHREYRSAASPSGTKWFSRRRISTCDIVIACGRAHAYL